MYFYGCVFVKKVCARVCLCLGRTEGEREREGRYQRKLDGVMKSVIAVLGASRVTVIKCD